MKKDSKLKNFNGIREMLKDHQDSIITILIFIFHLFFVFHKLQQGILEVNPDDGAKYVESGRLLLTWGLRDLAWGPLVAFIYAPIHIIFGNLQNWFLIEVWIGNVILFGFIWFSFYALMRTLDEFINKYVVYGLLISSVAFYPIIHNQSDALFVALSALSLTFLIRFHQKKKLSEVWLAGLFTALGVFARFESILLIIPLVLFGLILNRKRNKTYKILIACFVPLISILAIFSIVNVLSFGHPNLGVGNKSYESFMMNHAFLPGSKNQLAHRSGEEIYGSQHENNASVLRAIVRNPGAAAERALANILRLPDLFMHFFGKLQPPVLTILSLWGIYVLVKSREKTIILLLFIWPLQSLVSLLFLPLHIIPQMSYVFFVLSGIGITQLFSQRTKLKEKLILFAVYFSVLIFSIVYGKPAFIPGAVLMMIVFLMTLLKPPKTSPVINNRLVAPIVLLTGMVMFGFDYSFPDMKLGASAEEQAIHELQIALPDNSRVLVPYGTLAIAAKHQASILPRDIDSVEEISAFLIDNSIDAIVIDEKRVYASDIVEDYVWDNPEKFLYLGSSDDKSIQIYLTRND